ncbi:MAG: SAM-dependent methyltransferase [Prevotella sp.]|nr:SAM-dependent methyltransferase [Prevotella sp.]
MTIDEATRRFVGDHREEDVRRLALQGARFAGVDMPFALDQIRGWQAARTKLPSWAAVDSIVYPPHLPMEQCSSEPTARYKSALAMRLLKARERFVDLTGGFGVDFSFVAPLFKESVYVEQQPHLCELAEANFSALGMENFSVKNADSIAFLRSMSRVSLILVDPARRDDHGSKVFTIADCRPNVAALADELVEKADYVLLKLSPMLDWHQAVATLKHVREVHIVSVSNECKELLLVLSAADSGALRVCCVNDDDVFEFSESADSGASVAENRGFIGRSDRQNGAESVAVEPRSEPVLAELLREGGYLYEPNASVMKAGCFDLLARRYGVEALSSNSHLFVSSGFIDRFPGRRFRIQSVSSFNKREIRAALQGISRANIAVRNFPLSVDGLRKRLKLKEGGDVYLFATTLFTANHILIITKKLS